MPQSNFVIDDTTFPVVYTQLNSAIAALAQLSSGATAPSTTYPDQIWADTANALIKQRNPANNAWVNVGRRGQPFWGILPSDIGGLTASSNLSDLGNVATARANLGISDPTHNRILNGSFRLNQRGTASYNFGAQVKTLDRWNYDANAGGGTAATGTITQQSFTAGQTAVPGEPQNFIRLTNTTQGTSLGVTSYAYLGQAIEDVRTGAGQQVTVSFWARSTITSKTIGIDLTQNFGTGGSASTSVGGVTRTLSTTWQQFTATFTLPSISGKTIGTANTHFLGLYFWFQSGSSNAARSGGTITWQGTGDIEIANVQLEMGSVATSFEFRTLAEELRVAQRYYEVGSYYLQSYGTASSSYYAAQPYRNQKRVAPTVVLTDAEPLSIPFSNCGTAVSSTDVYTINVGVTVTGTGNYSFGVSWFADAEFNI